VMNPLIRGWSQYFRTGVASLMFSDLDTFMSAHEGSKAQSARRDEDSYALRPNVNAIINLPPRASARYRPSGHGVIG
jgi:hypothetical protein